MTDLFRLFATDEKLEMDGVWIEYGLNDAGLPIRFRIARAGGRNTEYAKALERATRPYRRAIQTGTIDPKIAENIYMRVFVDSVLLGWENVQDKDGTVIPFSRESAIDLFRRLPALYDDLREQAGSLAIFREEILEGDLKNSGKSSDTG
jgi:hypothetical protein